ncbi:ubie coq5, putative [Ichthyophthirius multifiliis]|uniref:Ubie coq5, putative n=1 Tax=Ichthyophthirius multifiliis TaxID=5932 RepID=G0QZK3_ICHMU|nr:ubie coq5, putative [Ichthyophthirius multifiliis]EGR29352.1 ubie coq5, putative [Ichthyophthirius multifiliis]|eukprot:XP_004030588.1 ubie coq5, putative [Ichthyophthirius multifiliis]
MVEIEKRNSILEVGAGGGYLLNHAMQRKKKNAQYIATDLTEAMIKVMCQRSNLEALKIFYAGINLFLLMKLKIL